MTDPAKPARPFSVTLLLCAVLSLTVWNLIRTSSALGHWNTLLDFAPYPGPLYIAVSGSLWTLGGATILWALLRRTRWARSGFLFYMFLYALWGWLDRLFLQAPRPNWPFALTVTIILLGFITLLTYHPGTTKFFKRESHEPKQEDSPSA